MNKGLELIEACHLFSISEHFVTVVVHPQSIIHSMVQYVDGSTLAQMGNPDMCTPIAHALAWPERLQTNVPALDLFEYSQLNFQAPDTQKFPALNLARQAMRAGGLAPTILNAANEIAVEAFLMERIGFTSIPQVVEHTLEKLENAAAESIECILDKDKVARSVAQQYISSIEAEMNALFMIAAAALLLGPLIAIHEFGHYWVARKLGVKVLVYSIGFGPTLLKWTSKKSGIKYQLSALPLGGYVKMLDEREGNVAEQDLPYAFNRQKPWKRIAIVAAGPLINLIFAVLLFWILFLPAQEQLNTKIGKIIPNSPAAAAQLHVGDKIIAVDGKETTTWEKLNFALIDRVGETGTVNIDVDRAGSEKILYYQSKIF